MALFYSCFLAFSSVDSARDGHCKENTEQKYKIDDKTVPEFNKTSIK